MSTECKFAQLALNLDMSGMVQPCHLTQWFLQDTDKRHFNVLTDDIKKIWSSEHRKKLLEDHQNGIKNPTCNFCWHAEDAGVESTRQQFNKELKDVEVNEHQPRIIILKPGNLCNNACRSCNAHTSSMWYKDDYQMGGQKQSYKEYLEFFNRHKTAYKDNMSLETTFQEWEDDIIFWDMYGGEPLIIPLFWKLLDQASSNQNANKKTFNIHTNGMVYKKDLVKKLSSFRKSSIGFSIDALGQKNDYIRYGSKWENILQNLQLYLKDCKNYSNVRLVIRTTITPWNVYHYDEIYDFFKKSGIVAGGGWCTDQTYNDVRYLPTHVKESIIKKLLLYQCVDDAWLHFIKKIQAWIMTTPTDYKEHVNSFMEYNNKLDQIRNEKFKDIFSEYAMLFN